MLVFTQDTKVKAKLMNFVLKINTDNLEVD
jgi:hypothetical protein